MTSVFIPNSVTHINSYKNHNSINAYGAFQECSNLSNINLGDNIQHIGIKAFVGCPCFLETVTIPKGVKSIETDAFDSKTIVFNADSCVMAGGLEYSNNPAEDRYTSAFPNMTSVSFGSNVKVMPAYLYVGMNPTTIDLPSSITIIPYNAFRGCINLETVNNVDNVESIGSQAFFKCESLNSFPVSLNSALSTIGRNAFSVCKNLKSITIPNSVRSISESAFSWCGLCSIEWGNSIDTIGERAFSYCNNLVDVFIPNSVNIIGYGAFEGCDNLSLLNIGNSVTTIESYAFNECLALTDILLPSSIRFINNHAFDGTMSDCIMTNITCMASNPPVLGEEVFGRRPIQAIRVPMASVEAYKTADGWSRYADVIVGI